MHLDYEKASANAFISVFPEGKIRRCFFHLSQAVWRKIQNCGLVDLYKSDNDFKFNIKRLLATAFLPCDAVEKTVLEMKSMFNQWEGAVELFDYFNSTYVSGPILKFIRGRPIHGAAQYTIEEWNVSQSMISNSPRTNNIQEGMHNRYRILSGRPHLGVWELVELLLDVHSKAENDLAKNIRTGGNGLRLITKKVKEVSNNLACLHKNYSAGQLLKDDFLSGVAMNISLTK